MSYRDTYDLVRRTIVEAAPRNTAGELRWHGPTASDGRSPRARWESLASDVALLAVEQGYDFGGAR